MFCRPPKFNYIFYSSACATSERRRGVEHRFHSNFWPNIENSATIRGNRCWRTVECDGAGVVVEEGGVAAERQIRLRDDPQLHRFLIAIERVISSMAPRSDGAHKNRDGGAVTLLAPPHLSQLFLIDSRALARLRCAQMFSTEPFIIEFIWFNLYLGVLQPHTCPPPS